MTAEDWQKFMEQNKLTDEKLREEARKDLAAKKLQEKLFGQITVREQEVTDFFNKNQSRFVNPRGVGLSDIVADPGDSGGAFPKDAKSEAEAAAKINSLYAQLKTGADFATVARANSEDQSLVARRRHRVRQRGCVQAERLLAGAGRPAVRHDEGRRHHRADSTSRTAAGSSSS